MVGKREVRRKTKCPWLIEQQQQQKSKIGDT